MKSNEKIMIAILVVITAVVIIAFVVTRNKDTKGGTSTQGASTSGTSTSQTSTSGTKIDDYVIEMPDGEKENTSEKLKETKIFDEALEVSDLKLTEKDGMTKVTGTVKNVSKEASTESAVTIVLLNKSGEELGTIPCYVKSLEPEETTSLQAERTLLDSAVNAYDLKMVKE